MSSGSTLATLLRAEARAATPPDEARWMDYVEHVAEVLDVGPGTTVWDAGCGAGAFLYPLLLNGYIVGGIEASADRLALARAAMPAGRFELGNPVDFDPAEPWAVVVASGGWGACRDLNDVRGLLARMAAKATHAMAVLGIDEEGGPRVGRSEILRVLAEIGASAVQFEHAPDARLDVFARVGGLRA